MYSQHYFDTYKGIVDNNDFRQSEIRIDSLLNSLKLENDMQGFIAIAHKFSIDLRKNSIEKAIFYANLEIETYNQLCIDDENFRNALFNLGRFYYTNNQFSESLDCFKIVAYANVDDNFTARAYCQIGKIYTVLGDYYRSVLYYEKGLDDLAILNDRKNLITHYLNVATVYEEIGTKESLDEMLFSLLKVDSLSKIVQIKERDQYILNNQLGDYYNNDLTFNYKISKKHYKKTIALAQKEKSTEVLGAAYNNTGLLLNKIKNDSAYIYLNKALDYIDEPEYTYQGLADYAYVNQDYKTAINYINQSIEYNIEKQKSKNEFIDVANLPESTDHYLLLLSIYRKATILVKKFEANNEIEPLNLALQNLKVADSIILFLQNKSQEESSKLHWRTEASAVYTLGVYIAELLNDENLAFSYIEKNKTSLLKEAIVKNTVKEQIPIRFKDRDFAFRKNISKIKIDLVANNTKKLRDSLFFLKLNYEDFQDSVKILMPPIDLKEITKPLSLKEVKDKMDDNMIIVSQIWNKNDEFSKDLFTLWISKNETILHKQKLSPNFENSILTLKNLLTTPFTTKESQTKFQNISHSLYKQLFATSSIKKMVKGKHLLIVPDGDLQNFVFDALITTNNSNDYLIKTNNISYANSVSFLYKNSERERIAKNGFLGFAPIKYDYDKLSNLPNSKNEIENSYRQFNGHIKLGTEATKKEFLKNSNNFNIIHLATHADAGEQPWIAFSDNKIYLNELYNSKNQAELVVLSACNTSLGETAKGEGVLSLTRGFFYAGANSVISNAWEANDKSTSEILQSFYKYFKEGMSKAKALQSAKIDYLKNHSLSESSPSYWASLLLVGGYEETITSNEGLSFLIIIIGSIIFMVFMFFAKKIQLKI
ncbi:hypothetical protein ULMS_17030 [Patiriisocius marinistellae]|uniref:CHAT domain-containing protein n=1 Tax=Patiriisocius marinistellae TaxID=2494560 RepID=A0A5J4G1C4_9FLAO|nr:CHAT domain-containing protein [Patiriisocius marinistellae]GEQ86195.1 hypothetical protein ULMS_17030 [Patiriisocius marinistellae]